VLPALASLLALHSLDSAAASERKRLGEIPSAEKLLADTVAEIRNVADGLKARLQDNHDKRRALEKEVAVVDSHLSRFDAHKAAVKTNQEFTALLHEISVAKADKDRLEEQQLVLMEEADGIAADLKTAERLLAEEVARADAARAQLNTERQQIEADLARLAAERSAAAATVDARTLALYEQLMKGRKGVAVARMTGEICEACHVRLRPHVTQQIRRNDSIVQCDSCQRILYYVAPAATTSSQPEGA
jgi:predicted  nucleic acid-binding Zn-ribbon protein